MLKSGEKLKHIYNLSFDFSQQHSLSQFTYNNGDSVFPLWKMWMYPLLGSKVDYPSEEQKDTYDNVSHKARFISSQLGSSYPPDAVGFNTDPKYKIQAAFIFF
jgi:hypothetical protein